MSESDIDKGSRGIEEISNALNTIEVGISCLTPENLNAPWLLFEAGALSKRIGERSRLCTYLLGGLGKGDVPQPLGMFQHTPATKEETRKMLESINKAINADGPINLDRIFERMWPDLENEIKRMPIAEKNVQAARPEREMIADILDIVRGLRDSLAETKAAGDVIENIGRALNLYAHTGYIPSKLEMLRNSLYSPKIVAEGIWIASAPKCPVCDHESIMVKSDGSRRCSWCGSISPPKDTQLGSASAVASS